MKQGLLLSFTITMAAGSLPVVAGNDADVGGDSTMTVRPRYEAVTAQLSRFRLGLGHFTAKLKAGGEVRVAYFGGSITAADGWRPGTLERLREMHPETAITEINAAIGGTGSALGAYRLEHDVLQYRPDLVFVEFAVNDSNVPPDQIWRSFDGIVRQIWTADPATDICFVYTFKAGDEDELDTGYCPQAASAEELLADHYGIPSINAAFRVAELRRLGKLIVKPDDYESSGAPAESPAPDATLFSNDGVHPLPAGHQIYTEVVMEAMVAMDSAEPVDHQASLAHPFVSDHWQAATMVPLHPEMLSAGWRRLDPAVPGLGKRFAQRLDEIWEADKPGETIRFRFRGPQAQLFDLLGPDAGQVMITVDGETRGPAPRFDKYCSYHRLATMGLGSGLDPDRVHDVEVTIHPQQPDRSAVLDRVRGEDDVDPTRYDGTFIRVGAILLIGEVVE